MSAVIIGTLPKYYICTVITAKNASNKALYMPNLAVFEFVEKHRLHGTTDILHILRQLSVLHTIRLHTTAAT